MVRHYFYSILAVSLLLTHNTTIGMQRKMWVTGITTAAVAATAATLHAHTTTQSNAATSHTKQFSPAAAQRLAAYGTDWTPTSDGVEPHMVIADCKKTVIVDGRELTFAEIVALRRNSHFPPSNLPSFAEIVEIEELRRSGFFSSAAFPFLQATHLVVYAEGNFIDLGLLSMTLTNTVASAVIDDVFCYTPLYFMEKGAFEKRPIGALIVGPDVADYTVAATLHAKILEYVHHQATTPSSHLIPGLNYSTVSTDPNDYGPHQIHVSVGATGIFNKAQ